MVIRSSGDADVAVLVSGSGGERLRVATAFGTSMLPFLKPGVELRLESLDVASIRLGDVITFESQPGTLVTHRVVKILPREGGISFLTKGDNRLVPDPVIFGHQIFDRVIQVGGTNVRSLGWRVLGRIIAWISYGQSVLYHGLAKSRLNRLRYWLEKKGWCPGIPLRPWFAKFSNPMSWLTRFQSAVRDLRAWQLHRRLSWHGIEIQRWSAKDAERMTQAWNESFPGYQTTTDRLDKMFCHSPWFDASGCFVIKKRGDGFLGWALARLNFENSQIKTRSGSIDVFALTKEGWRVHADLVLFQTILEWFKKRRVRQIFINAHPIPKDPLGIPLTPLMIASSAFGFEPTEVSITLTVIPKTYHQPNVQELPEAVTVRAWHKTDDAAVNDFFQRNGRLDVDLLYDPGHARPAGGTDILVATLHGSVVGFCRWILDDEIRDYSDVTWVWILSTSNRRRGYFLRLLVDKTSRRQGIGTALAVRAFECLFHAGCQEIALVVVQDKAIEHFYERFGFQTQGYFLKSRRLEKN